MTWFSMAQSLLMIALFVLIIVFIVALVQLIRTLSSIDTVARNIDKSILPLASEIETLLNGVNTKLARMEDIVTSVQEVSEKIHSTSEAAKKVIASPATRVATWAGGARVLWQAILSRRRR